MDPLSDVLSLLKPRSYMCGGVDVGGGNRWLAVDGVPDAIRLTPVDCFLLPRGRPFRLATDLNLTPVDALTLLAAPWRHRAAGTASSSADTLP